MKQNQKRKPPRHNGHTQKSDDNMSNNLARGLKALELLAHHAEGLPLHAIAEGLDVPRSTAHKVLAELVSMGYVRQAEEFMPYRLSLKIATLGLHYFASTGVSELIQPVLDRLALASGELARMSLVENERLIWVAKAQGARRGLRFDAASDPGEEVRLFCSSNGQAWLSTLSDEKALEIASRQGFGSEHDYGPNAPRNILQFLERLQAARESGFAVARDAYEIGTSAIAAPVLNPKGIAIGAVSIAGPSARMSPERMDELAPLIIEASRELSAISESILAANR